AAAAPHASRSTAIPAILLIAVPSCLERVHRRLPAARSPDSWIVATARPSRDSLPVAPSKRVGRGSPLTVAGPCRPLRLPSNRGRLRFVLTGVPPPSPSRVRPDDLHGEPTRRRVLVDDDGAAVDPRARRAGVRRRIARPRATAPGRALPPAPSPPGLARGRPPPRRTVPARAGSGPSTPSRRP